MKVQDARGVKSGHSRGQELDVRILGDKTGIAIAEHFLR